MTDRHRSAVTGQFVTAEHAKTNPDTTVSEARTRRPAGDYSDLRARAEACPPEDDFNAIWYSEDRLEFAIGTRDRPFVAACSPAVVLGLLDELDRLRGVVHTQGVALDGYRELERLRAEPIVRTVGDLTARHIGRRVRVGKTPPATRMGLSWREVGVRVHLFTLDAEAAWQNLPLNTPVEVLP